MNTKIYEELRNVKFLYELFRTFKKTLTKLRLRTRLRLRLRLRFRLRLRLIVTDFLKHYTLYIKQNKINAKVKISKLLFT